MFLGLLIVLVVIIACLAIPVECRFKLKWPDVAHNEIVLCWGFGLVRSRILPVTSDNKSSDEAEIKAASKHPKSKRPQVLMAIRQRSFRKRIYRFVIDFWRLILKRNVQVHARIGLADPASTGQLWALLGPVSGVLAQTQDIDMVILPEFLEPTLEVDSRGQISLIPLRVIATTIALFFSPAIWRGMISTKPA